jgi:hypothetical protein
MAAIDEYLDDLNGEVEKLNEKIEQYEVKKKALLTPSYFITTIISALF